MKWAWILSSPSLQRECPPLLTLTFVRLVGAPMKLYINELENLFLRTMEGNVGITSNGFWWSRWMLHIA